MHRNIFMSGMLATVTLAVGQNAVSATPASSLAGRQAARHAVKRAPRSVRMGHVVRAKPLPTRMKAGGQVLMANGAPAANANVYMSWLMNTGASKTQKIAADANGRFTQIVSNVQPVDGMIHITALLPGKGVVTVFRNPGEKTLQNLTLKLQPGVTMTGRMIGPDGAPAANVEVGVSALTASSPFGNFRFNNLVFNGAVNNSAVVDTNGLQQFETAMLINNVAPQQAAIITAASETNVDLNTAFAFAGNAGINMINGANLISASEVPALYHTRTDASGRFTLVGLPSNVQVTLAPGGGLAFMSGSATSISLIADHRQDAGDLVTTPTGGLKIHVKNATTHAPMANTQVFVYAKGANPFFAASSARTVKTDVKGDATVTGLGPGEYQVQTINAVSTASVQTGDTKTPVELSVKEIKMLKGRVVDAKGAPIAGIQVSMRIGDVPSMNGFDHVDPMPFTQTGPDGTFNMPFQNLGGAKLTLRAVQGNDMAEWSGTTDKLATQGVNENWLANNLAARSRTDLVNTNVTLQMKPNALVSVEGRLIDPNRQPIRNANCMALHWQASPRAAWFNSAKQIQADNNGHFRVDGLEPGESFSLVANGTINHVMQLTKATGAQKGAGSTKRINSFESPRFETLAVGKQQSLGDVMVLPSDTPDDVQQDYGIAPPTSDPTALIAEASPDAVREAQKALISYRQALETGDLDKVHAMTALVSPGWSADRATFLRQTTLCNGGLDGDHEPMRALRFVPGGLTKQLLQMSAKVRAKAKCSPQTDSAKDWVFLARQHDDKVLLAGILHREDGEWRVVSNILQPNADASTLINGNSMGSPDAKSFNTPGVSPTMSLTNQARLTGEKFLRAWSEKNTTAMMEQTSPFAFNTPGDLEHFEKQLGRRADDGMCPMPEKAAITLRPVDNITLYEQRWLAQVIQARFDPNQAIRQGNLATFRYTTPTGEFLMILTHSNNKWQVLEPALAL